MSPADSAAARRARVGGAVAWELAERTTEHDREIALLLYRQKILTTRLAQDLAADASVAPDMAALKAVADNLDRVIAR
ncbi:MAG TPA: hypothetical protein VGO31_00395 [Microbacteriaceae bacterium]|nr:hypothetical protein [Microbacteriaceae bacterium]